MWERVKTEEDQANRIWGGSIHDSSDYFLIAYYTYYTPSLHSPLQFKMCNKPWKMWKQRIRESRQITQSCVEKSGQPELKDSKYALCPPTPCCFLGRDFVSCHYLQSSSRDRHRHRLRRMWRFLTILELNILNPHHQIQQSGGIEHSTCGWFELRCAVRVQVKPVLNNLVWDKYYKIFHR